MEQLQPTPRRNVTRRLAVTGILAALAVVLMYLEFPIPLMPTFLKFDFSEIPVLIAGFALGPLSAVVVELIKNLAHYPVTQSAGVGELANFVIGCALVVPASLIYKYKRTRSGALIGLAAGTLIMTAVASIGNYFVMIPFYAKVIGFPMEAIFAAANAAGNKLVTDLWTLILYVFIPFNLLKGIVVSLVVLLIYKKISHLINSKRFLNR